MYIYTIKEQTLSDTIYEIYMKSSTLSSIRSIIVLGIFMMFLIYICFHILLWWIQKRAVFNYPAHSEQDIFYDRREIQNIIDTHKNPEQHIRNEIIDRYIVNWFTGRATTIDDNLTQITPWENRTDIIVDNTSKSDQLDNTINNFLQSRKSIETQAEKPPFLWTYDALVWLKDIQLYKTKEDLDRLWYRVVSHRHRKNYDPEYRRFNISTALQKYWATRIIVPWEEIAYLEAIEYDAKEQQNYKSWITVVLDEDQDEYGWGLCWWSTAIYQWVLTNKALELTEWRNHSKRFTNLYKAKINGEETGSAGLDSTVYDGYIDLKIKNIRDYPIILVTAYDWSYGGEEIVLTLWLEQDQWSYTYSSSYSVHSELFIDKKPRNVMWSCFHREVNWEDQQSCYKVVDKIKLR